MFSIDLLLSFGIIALLFLRQIAIVKRPNKLNYAPLIIGMGAIGTAIHFILHPDTSNMVFLLRESLFPLLFALILYIIMDIVHQTQISENAKKEEEFTKLLVEEITDMKNAIVEMEEKFYFTQKSERNLEEEREQELQKDRELLSTIQENQISFIDELKEMQEWHKKVSLKFDFFSDMQLPELDNIVHKHIDILRIAEQDHYNKLTKLLQKSVESRGDISEEIIAVKENFEHIKNIADEISQSITKETRSKLSVITKDFESQILSLQGGSQSLSRTLEKSEETLKAIHTQSETIMQQMLLFEAKMSKIEQQNSNLYTLYEELKKLTSEVASLSADYLKAESQLETISHDIASSKDAQILALKAKIDMLSETLSQKIDASLEKLHEHYHITNGEITESVKMLAKQARLKNSPYKGGYNEVSSQSD